MSDRKYRQRGYQDDDRERQPAPKTPRPAPEPGAPAGARRISQDGPRNINMPGFREVVRCAQCGAVIDEEVGLRQPLPAVRHRPARLLAVRVVRPGQPLRVHAADPRARDAEEHRNTCTLYAAAHHRRTRDDDAARR